MKKLWRALNPANQMAAVFLLITSPIWIYVFILASVGSCHR